MAASRLSRLLGTGDYSTQVFFSIWYIEYGIWRRYYSMESLARTDGFFFALYYDVMDSLTFWNNLRSYIYIPCLSLYRRLSTSFHLNESPLALRAMVGRTQQRVDKNDTLARVTLFAQICILLELELFFCFSLQRFMQRVCLIDLGGRYLPCHLPECKI